MHEGGYVAVEQRVMSRELTRVVANYVEVLGQACRGKPKLSSDLSKAMGTFGPNQHCDRKGIDERLETYSGVFKKLPLEVRVPCDDGTASGKPPKLVKRRPEFNAIVVVDVLPRHAHSEALRKLDTLGSRVPIEAFDG